MESVFVLLSELCESLARQNEYKSGVTLTTNSLKRIKSTSQKIILKKSNMISYFYKDNNDEFDANRTFAYFIFAAKLSNRFDCIEHRNRIIELEEKMQHLLLNTGSYNVGQICHLLLVLQSNNSTNAVESKPNNSQSSQLLISAPFSIYGNKESKHHTAANNTVYNLVHPTPIYFKSLTHTKICENVHLHKSFFKKERTKLYNIEHTYKLCKEKGKHNARVLPFRLYGDLSLKLTKKNLEHKAENGTAAEKSKKTHSTHAYLKNETCIFSWNWESLACSNVFNSSPFVGESIVSFDMLGHHFKTIGQALQAKVITHQKFLQDLKALTVGIQSESFWHDEYILFYMHNNLTVDGLLPITIRRFIKNFLECGTCYKRLQLMIKKKDYKLMFEGFIFKALCNAIDEYLISFRQYVFAQEDTTFLNFFKRLQRNIAQLTNLSFTLAIHPEVDASIKPPLGSQLIGYLYREIMRLTESEYLTFLIFLLKRCCHVYFKRLQKWIYYGVLDDPSNELFICFLDHYRQNTKYFYEKAYFIRKESVPGFFQSYENQILQCGKYTTLLKAFKPNHPLFHMKYPAMSVCLSFAEIDQLDALCKNYSQLAGVCCGKPITIREIFEARVNQKRVFCQMAGERSKANMEKWLTEQHTLILNKVAQKKKRFDQLAFQLQEEKQRKINERRTNVELELKLLREAQKMNDCFLVNNNINLRKRIEYYEELSNLMNEDANADKGSCKIPTISLTLIESDISTQDPHTPSSVVGTDFESCEEDENSEYTECISDEFVQQFVETETELNTLYNHDPKKEADGNPNTLTKNLKRSISDLLNSNNLISTAQENRQQAMSGREMALTVQPNKMSSSSSAEIEKMNTMEIISDARRNKFKVLSAEFDVHRTAHQKIVPDVNLNTLPNTVLSEVQRNRKRMMENNPFSQLDKDPFNDRSQLHLEFNTERSRNRRKVLESEFNILPNSKTITTVHISETPMSTTSDSSFSDILIDTKANNENVTDNEMALLQCSSLESKSNPIPNQTPECALNSTDILADREFDFNNTSKIYETVLPAQNDNLTSDECNENENYIKLQHDYSKPYSRCLELLDTNFQCPTRSSYIHLRKLPLRNYNSNTVSASDYKHFLSLGMNSMNAITLTDFLQQSVIKPMNVHFKILNNEVMRMFIDDLQLLDHFRSLRFYFFLMNGEFSAKICNGILEQLDGENATPHKLLNYQMLHSILDTALGSSIIGINKHADQLSFMVTNIPDHFDLSSPNVLETLSLSYHVDWPLNIILSPDILEQYSKIFRYLIKVRRISWLLEHSYQLLKEAIKTFGNKLLRSPQYKHIQLIRHKFYHFIHSLQNHITANALQASWKTFKDNLLQANSIEDISRKHSTYLKKILQLCMLSRRSTEFHNTIENIFKIILHFYHNLKQSEFEIISNENESHYIHSQYNNIVSDELEFDKLIKHTIYLAEKIVRHGDQTEIGEFINLINFNQYYIHTC